MLCREWPGFTNGRAAHGNPVEEGRGVQVQELAKELLVHVERRIGVAADSELQTGIEHDMRIAHAQYRLHAYVEDRVIGVALHDLRHVGERECSPDIALAEISADGQEVSGMITEGAPCLGLQQRTWRSIPTEQPGIHLVQRGVV